jgi:DNA processing protein
MVRRIAADLPLAVLGIVATVTVTTKLLDLTDALSTAVLGQSDGQALHFLGRFSGLGLAGGGFAVVVVGLLVIVAALLLWIELMVRSALVYLLVAVSPLAFAAMVWPAARGVLRRTSHLLLAVIASKFVIAVALAVGVAALGGTIPGANELASGSVLGGAVTNGDPGAGLGMVFVGAVILSLAAFAPFIVLRLIPVAEAAVGAQGVSRGPARATQAGLGTYYYAHSLGRLGGSGAPTAGATLGGAGSAPPASGAGSAGPAAGRAASGGGAAAGGATATIGAARTAGRSATTAARDASQSSPPSGASGAAVKPEPAGRPAATDPTRRTP